MASQNEQEEVLGHLTFQPHIHDAEEYLSPSPLAATFDHSNLSPAMATTGMKRSASSSSSFHIPTPSHVTYVHPFGAPYYSTSSSASPTPDWAAMQFAQSYLPSPSHPPSSFPNTPVLGRNTPSPLPTLGELRTLSRSNSAAARAQAMSKLTGGKETPSDEDHNMHASSSRPNLQRADSLGTPTFGLATARTGRTQHGQEPLALNIQELRPRLQRSFTVSSSNMGEERRSAVGRRMMDRLAGRDAVRDQEREDEERKVRRLWEERHSASQENPDSEAEGSVDEDEDDTATLPKFERRSSVKPPQLRPTPVTEGALLVAPDRAISRNTMLSGEEAFEYEAHLRRSLSSRTARGTAGVTAQQVPAPSSQLHRNQAERHDEHIHGLIEHLPEEDPSLHQAPFHTPSRHVQQNSTSTGGTARLDHSPGRDSTPTRDALGSMLFVMGRGSASSSVTGGRIGEANWPMEVEENNGSDWVTPAKDFHRMAQTLGTSESY